MYVYIHIYLLITINSHFNMTPALSLNISCQNVLVGNDQWKPVMFIPFTDFCLHSVITQWPFFKITHLLLSNYPLTSSPKPL